MPRPLTLKHLQQAIRARICSTCPNRTVALDGDGVDFSRPCEATCSLFVNMPALHEIAIQTDPLVGHRSKRLLETARTWGDNARRSARRVATTIEELVEP